MTLTDHDLDALHDGGPPLEQWYASYSATLHGYLARRVGRELAEDLTAQVFVEAIESYHRFDPERGSPKTWLFAIATNLMRNHVRKEQRALELYARRGVDPLVDESMGEAEARFFAAEEWPRVAAALAELKPLDRDVLLLYCFGDLDYAEIADALGIAVGTVGSKMNRIRTKLRKRLGDDPRGEGR